MRRRQFKIPTLHYSVTPSLPFPKKPQILHATFRSFDQGVFINGLPEPFSFSGRARVLSRADAESGFKRRASWNWRIASSIWPFMARATPRLLWVSSSLGFRRITSWYWLIASSSRSSLRKAITEVVVGVDSLGFQADGLLEFADGLIGLTLLEEGDCPGYYGHCRHRV